MTTKQEPALFNTTMPVPTSFLNVFTPRKFKKNGKETGEPKFDGTFMFAADSEDVKAMKAIAIRVAKAYWPSRDIAADLKANNFTFPFSDGTKKADKAKAKATDGKDPLAYARGLVLITGRSKYRPALAILENGGCVDLTEENQINAHKAKFYSGVECLAQFNFQAFEGGNGPDGVNVYLNMVLSTNRGKKIAGGSGGASAAATFSGYVGKASGEDPTGGGEAPEESDDPNAGLEGLI